MRPSWWSRCACLGLGTDLFFALEGSDDQRKALTICKGCPVRAQCLAYAEKLEQDTTDPAYITGVYGGKTARERLERKTQ